ncbi:MAG TPA: CoA transferase [Blastocatellia bacterium]|nr:CoA transferase [Blastocatellia bacterium]
MPGPLEGVRVIDFGRFIAGPYCAMLFADMGADVIRVERRDGGEDRYLGPIAESGEGGLFLNLNRNKRGLACDIAHPLAYEILCRLVESADIVIVNLPISDMKRLRLDYDSLCRVRPDIIEIMISAYGPDGPYANRVGFDGVVQAMSGAMSLTGFPETPVRSIVSYVDYGTALHAAFGAMVALYERRATGRGRLIDVSLLATGVTFMLPLLAERAVTGIRRAQQGNTGYYSAPSDVYRTRDGWIIVPTIGNHMFRRWARLMQREDLLSDPRFSDDLSRGDNAEVINDIMSEWCAARTREEAIAELERARIPCGPVYDLDEAMADPQVKARSLLKEVEYPGASKPVPIASTPVRLGQNASSLRRAPALGEHTDEILSQLGFSKDEIASFRREGVV